jgi:acetyl esterase/lipase
MSWAEFQRVERVAPDLSAAWGDHPDAFGEWYLPTGSGPHPVVVLVHGGCWRSIASVDYVSHLGRAFADWGWATWVPEFRRVDQEDGAWPAILEDVGAAVDYLREAPESLELDLRTVAVAGHSSGGHLALWLASRHRLPDDGPTPSRGDAPLPIHGVVSLAGIADLEDFDRRGGGGCGADAVDGLLGRLDGGNGDGDPGVADRMEWASPLGRLPMGVPQLVIMGGLDRTVPAAHGEAWVNAAVAAGDAARLLIPPRAGHFELVAPWTDPFGVIEPELRAFLDSLRVSPNGSPR